MVRVRIRVRVSPSPSPSPSPNPNPNQLELEKRVLRRVQVGRHDVRRPVEEPVKHLPRAKRMVVMGDHACAVTHALSRKPAPRDALPLGYQTGLAAHVAAAGCQHEQRVLSAHAQQVLVDARVLPRDVICREERTLVSAGDASPRAHWGLCAQIRQCLSTKSIMRSCRA